MPLKKLNFSVSPLNATVNGFSYRSGYPTIKFQLPSQQAMLETSSLRLVGRYQVKPTSSTLINPTNTNFTDVQDNPADANLEECSAITFSPFGGISTVIDKVIIQSKKSQAELTSNNNYSQFVALKTSRYGTKEDFRNALTSRSFSLGENAEVAQRRFNISDSTATSENQGQEFSVSLDIDLLKQNLLLDEDHLGGLLITIHLNPESAFFSTFQNGSTTPQTTAIDGYSYVLHQLKLEGRTLIPTPQEMAGYPPAFLLDNHINLLQDVHSSRSSTILTPMTSSTKAILNLFLLQAQTNNYNLSQFSYPFPVGLKAITQNKESQRYPLQFTVKSSPNYTTTGAENITTIYYKALQTNTTEARLHFERSLLDGLLPAYSSATLVLSEKALKNQELASSAATSSTNLAVDSVGIGSDYTFGMVNSTQNFRNKSYTLNLDSGVQTQATKLPLVYRASSLLQQTFIRNTSLFNTTTLVKTN